MGGTLKVAMADEIKRVLLNTGGSRAIAAVTLGISARTLDKWLKSWEELHEVAGAGVSSIEDVFVEANKQAKKLKKKKTKKKKTSRKSVTDINDGTFW